jgi:hypothetical protein
MEGTVRILVALLVLVASPVQAASILYLTDHRGVGASFAYWSSSNDGPSDSFYWEPCEQFAPDCVANAGGWNGAVDHESHLRSDPVYGEGSAYTHEQPCDSESCFWSSVYGRIAITFTVDEDSAFLFTSTMDGVLAPIVSGVLRAGEVFSVGGELGAVSWPESPNVRYVREGSFGFRFSLVSVSESSTAVLMALGIAVLARRNR